MSTQTTHGRASGNRSMKHDGRGFRGEKEDESAERDHQSRCPFIARLNLHVPAPRLREYPCYSREDRDEEESHPH